MTSATFRTMLTASVAMLLSGGGEAASVKYYSRQKLVSTSVASPYSYTPTYGSYGACSNGSQSASVSTCTRNDGTVVANSYCSPATTSRSCASTVTCAMPTDNQLPGDTSSSIALGTLSGPNRTPSGAQTVCNAYVQQNSITVPQNCYYQTTGSTPYTVYLFPGNSTKFYNQGGYFLGACK